MATKKKPIAREAMPDPLAPPPAQAQLAVAPAADNAALESIATINTQLAEIDKVETGLAELEKTYKGVAYACADPKGMKDAIAARLAIKTPRIAVEHARKAAKAPINALGRQIDGRAAEITARLVALEDPIDEQIKAQERREADRKAAIETRLGEIRETADAAIGKGVAELEQIVEALNTLDLPSFEEYREQAAAAQQEATRKVTVLLVQTRANVEAAAKLAELEKEQTRVNAIRARIAAIRGFMATAAMARSSATLERILAQVTTIEVGPDFQELQGEATDARLSVMTQLRELITTKKQAEAVALAALQAAATPAPTAAPTPEPTTAPVAIAAVGRAAIPAHVAALADKDGPVMRLCDGIAGGAIDEAPQGPSPTHDLPAADRTTELGVMPERPSDTEIVQLLADHFDQHEMNVLAWLTEMDLQAQRDRILGGRAA